MESEFYYFGCVGQKGHHFYDENLKKVFPYQMPKEFPFNPSRVDGVFLPHTHRSDQGVANHFVVAGWTVINFCDYSVDDRGGSHSLFFIKRECDFDESIDLIKQQFPTIFKRFNFEVVKFKAI